jgi:hypothetical protein
MRTRTRVNMLPPLPSTTLHVHGLAHFMALVLHYTIILKSEIMHIHHNSTTFALFKL